MNFVDKEQRSLLFCLSEHDAAINFSHQGQRSKSNMSTIVCLLNY